MKNVILAAATALMFAAPAFAQTPTTKPAKPVTEDQFTKHDLNADGVLSVDEVKSADAKVTQADFDKYDADKSRTLSKDEFRKWVETTSTPPASAPG